jgi:hypothetical protein
VIALVSAKGSPGVTVSALALALAAPGRCLLVEADPAGGDLLAGYLRGQLPAGRGLARLAVAELRGRLREEFDDQLVDLDPPARQRLLLPGVVDPAQSATVASVWQPITARLCGPGRDPAGTGVVVDCGRYTAAHFGWPLVGQADRVLLVVRGTLPSVAAAVPAVRELARRLAGQGRAGPELLVVDTGPYRPAELAERLATPLAGVLPEDARAAARLSFGGPAPHRLPLLTAATRLHRRLAATPPAVAATAEAAGV